MENVEQLFATMQQSVIDVWKKHLLSKSNDEHTVLGDFYESALREIDRIIETYFGINGTTLLNGQSAIIFSENENSLDYMIELKEYIESNKEILGNNSELQSEMDELMSLIDGTIYKLRELCGIVTSEDKQQISPDYTGFENDDAVVIESKSKKNISYVKNFEQFMDEKCNR